MDVLEKLKAKNVNKIHNFTTSKEINEQNNNDITLKDILYYKKPVKGQILINNDNNEKINRKNKPLLIKFLKQEANKINDDFNIL